MMSADDELWEQRFAELERYIRIFGHARIAPVGIHSKLRIWLLAQEHKAVAGMLPPARLARLAALGVEVFTREECWQIRFAQLREFREQFGHTRVAGKWKPNPQLGNWVHAQRGAQRRGQLQAERIRQLDTLGFEWIPPSPIVPIEQRWEEMFAHLVRYRQQHGDTEVPKHYAEVPDLAEWMRRQRRSGNRGQMPARHRARLEAIGFAWEHDGRWPRDRWEERFTQLLAFRERFGHTRVPAKWKENIPLGHWVAVQREFRRKGMLSATRIQRLEGLGFEWNLWEKHLHTEDRWGQMCAHFAEFMREHGHARVPKAFPPVPGLKQWVTRQRRLMRGGSLPEDRRAKLEAMGFPWGDPPVSSHDHWEQRFARLLEYRARFGHCRVPVHWKEDGAFGYWAYTQRAFKKEGSLSSERIARLEAIGFEWEIPSSRAFHYEEQWEAMFSRLLEWRKEHGHTEVSSADSGGTLGTWVQTQRKHWRKGTLQPEHRRKLEAIGFAWRATRRDDAHRWEQRYRQLVAFRGRFGHCRVPAKW
ncbi:MAG: helicase associated domain-containing protein, partial [Chthoniobacteraceae bacterium]